MTATAPVLASTEDRQTTTLAVVRTDPLADAVRQFESTMGLATALVRSGFLPKAINTPEKAVAVILAGRELGIGPMLALRSISIIDGKPVVAADLQLARFKADGGRAEFTELTEKKATLHLTHPNGDSHIETFSIEDAGAAQLLNKDNWKKFKKAMLRSRCITAALKSIGYEPTCGVYDPDEADHFSPGPASRAPKATVAVAGGAEREETTVDAVVTTDDASDEPPEVVRNTEWALNYPFPFQRGTAIHGRPLSQLSVKHLENVKKWIVDKRVENSDAEWNDEAYDAISLVLKFRATDPAQAALPLGDEPPAAAAGPNPSTLAPGKVEDALELEPKAAAGTLGITDLTKRITVLLQDKKLEADERADFKKKLDKADTIEAMQLLVAEIETVLEQPF